MFGNIAQLKARNSNKIIQAELTWDKRIRLHENDKAIQEIILGENNLIRLNSCVLYPYQISIVFISTDANSHALSAQFFERGRKHICLKNFTEYEIKQSSTWMKLFAIQFPLHSFTPKIINKSIDNYAPSLIVAYERNKAHW